MSFVFYIATLAPLVVKLAVLLVQILVKIPVLLVELFVLFGVLPLQMPMLAAVLSSRRVRMPAMPRFVFRVELIMARLMLCI
jgi:hypothetical protein